MNCKNFWLSLRNKKSQFLKTTISIALIIILMLNVMGYYGVFMGLQYRNDQAMINSFENDGYTESQTITLKIPLAVPYVTSNGEFERVDGKFEYSGQVYRLIKQRYAEDTLTVVCFRDAQDGRIEQAMSDFVKTFSDTNTDHSQNSKVTITFIKDYIQENFSIGTTSFGWLSDVSAFTACTSLIPSYSPSVIHPPERG